jgi:hypothetical protein
MSFQPPLEPGESIHHHLEASQPGRAPLRLVLTDRAVYWPGSASRPVRVPVGQIHGIEVTESRRIGIGLAVSAIAFLALLGAYLIVGSQSLLLVLVLVGGIGLRTLTEPPRLTITLNASAIRYSWTEPPHATDALTTNARAATSLLREWAETYGVPFVDRRRR